MVDNEYSIRKSYSEFPLWENRLPLLKHLDIELTERCNNACIHCYINLPEKDFEARSRELSTDEWKRIIQQAVDLGALSIRFTGGEPLLRQDFQELYLFARKAGLKVKIYTNGRLITHQLAELFSRVPPLAKIEITVYGMHPESYDKAACSPGAYQEFQQGISLLIDYKIPFFVKWALLPPNRHEVLEFEEWAMSLPGMDESPGYAAFFDLRGRRDMPGRNRLIENIRLTPDEGLEFLTRDAESYKKNTIEFCTHIMGPSGNQLFDCGAGRGGCVDAYGRYQPCMLLRDPQLSYDLRQGSLKDALQNFFPGLKEIRATNPLYLERCSVCFLHGLCEQCPAKSWSEHGTLDTPVEYLCQVAHKQAEYLGLLSPGEKAWMVTDGEQRVKNLNKKEED
jgi:radical SAM protein with 4Fe4S-binding SPASM domain